MSTKTEEPQVDIKAEASETDPGHVIFTLTVGDQTLSAQLDPHEWQVFSIGYARAAQEACLRIAAAPVEEDITEDKPQMH